MSETNYSPEELEYLSSLPTGQQQFFKRNPDKFIPVMEAHKAQMHYASDSSTDSSWSKSVAASKDVPAPPDIEQPEKVLVQPVGFIGPREPGTFPGTEVMEQAPGWTGDDGTPALEPPPEVGVMSALGRIVPNVAVRTANFAMSTVGAASIDLADRVLEYATNGSVDLASPELISRMYKGLDPREKERLASMFGTLDKPNTGLGIFVEEAGPEVAGYLMISALVAWAAPVSIPAAYIAGTSKLTNMMSKTHWLTKVQNISKFQKVFTSVPVYNQTMKKAMGVMWDALPMMVQSGVAATVVGSDNLLVTHVGTEGTPLGNIWESLTGDNLATWYSKQPEIYRAGLRGLEAMVMNMGVEGLLGGAKVLKGQAGGLVEPTKDYMKNFFGDLVTQVREGFGKFTKGNAQLERQLVEGLARMKPKPVDIFEPSGSFLSGTRSSSTDMGIQGMPSVSGVVDAPTQWKPEVNPLVSTRGNPALLESPLYRSVDPVSIVESSAKPGGILAPSEFSGVTVIPSRTTLGSPQSFTGVRVATTVDKLPSPSEFSGIRTAADKRAQMTIISTIEPTVEEAVAAPVKGAKPKAPKVIEAPAEVIKKAKLSKVKPAKAKKDGAVEVIPVSDPRWTPSRAQEELDKITTSPNMAKTAKNNNGLIAPDSQTAQVLTAFLRPNQKEWLDKTIAAYGKEVVDTIKKKYNSVIKKLTSADTKGITADLTGSRPKYLPVGFSKHIKRPGGGAVGSIEVAPQWVYDAIEYAVDSPSLAIAKAAETVGNPMLAGVAYATYDMMDGDKEFSISNVFKVMAGGFLIRNAGLYYQSYHAGMTLPTKEALKTAIMTNSLEGASVVKALTQVSIANPSLKRIFGEVSEELLSKTGNFVDRMLESVNISDGTLVNLRKLNLKPDAKGNFHGAAGVLSNEAFTSVAALQESIGTMFADALSKLKSVPLDAAETLRVDQRYLDLFKDYGSHEATEDFMSLLHQGTPEGKRALLVALDCVEKTVLSDFEAVMAKHAGTAIRGDLSIRSLATLGEFGETLGRMRSWFKFLENPGDSLLTVSDSIGVTQRSSWLKLFPENTTSPKLKEWALQMNYIMDRSAAFVNDGKFNVPEGLRKSFIEFVNKIDESSDLSAVATAGLFQALLSRPGLTTASIASNITGQMLQLGSDVFYGGLRSARGDFAHASAVWKSFGAFFKAMPSSAVATKYTLETGRKPFDILGMKPAYSTAVLKNVGEAIGLPTSTAQHLMNISSKAWGMTPGDAMKAVDVFPQMLSHRMILERELDTAVYDRMRTAGVTYAEALKHVNDTPSVIGPIYERALNKSRAYTFIEPLKQQLRGGELKEDLMAQMISYGGKILRAHPILVAYEPFFATAMNATHLGIMHTPVSFLFDFLNGSKGLFWKSTKLTGEAALKHSRAKDEVLARTLFGTGAGLGLLATVHTLGGRFISSMQSADLTEKNLGAKVNTIYFEDTGESIDLGMFEHLAPLINIWNNLEILGYHMYNGTTAPRRVAEELSGASLLLEMMTSTVDSGLADLHKSIGNLSEALSSRSRGDKTLSFINRFLQRASGMLDPQIFIGYEEAQAGLRLLKADNVPQMLHMEDRMPKRNIFGDHQELPEAGPMDLVARSRKLENSEYAKLLAQGGVKTDYQSVPDYRGMKITDRKLLDKFQEIRGKYLKSPKNIGRLTRFLRKDPSKAKDILGEANDYARASLFKTLEDYYAKNK